jgi:hypothetical protein
MPVGEIVGESEAARDHRIRDLMLEKQRLRHDMDEKKTNVNALKAQRRELLAQLRARKERDLELNEEFLRAMEKRRLELPRTTSLFTPDTLPMTTEYKLDFNDQPPSETKDGAFASPTLEKGQDQHAPSSLGVLTNISHSLSSLNILDDVASASVPSPVNSTDDMCMSSKSSSANQDVVLDRDTKKKELIERVMNYFSTFFASGISEVTSGTPSVTGKRNESRRNDSLSTGSSRGDGSRNPSKRKREDAPDNNSDDKTSRQFHRQTNGEDLVQNLKFACPYFQRDRRKYQRWRSCPGPGWDTVHRVK